MIVLVLSLFCTPADTSIEVFLSVTLQMLVLVRCFVLVLVVNFSYNPDDTFSKVFL